MQPLYVRAFASNDEPEHAICGQVNFGSDRLREVEVEVVPLPPKARPLALVRERRSGSPGPFSRHHDFFGWSPESPSYAPNKRGCSVTMFVISYVLRSCLVLGGFIPDSTADRRERYIIANRSE